MISSNFGFGEQSAIASAYTKMYAPKDVTESCCGCSKKSEKKVEKKAAKKSVKESAADKLPTKHTPPKGTGSKLGARKMLDFKKRDAKPMCKGTKKCCTEGFCISDGEKTLCTNDVGESYFSETGITGETRIYESAVSALKDIKKVNALRKPSKKYNIRKCQCVGESFEFVNKADAVNEAWWNPLDAVGGAVKGVGNLVGAAGNAMTGDFDAAGKNLSGAWDNAKQAAAPVTGAVSAGIDAAKAAGNAVADSATKDGGVLNTIGGVAKDAVSTGADAVKNVGQGALNTVGGTVGAAGNLVGAAGNAISGDLEGAKKELGGAWDNAKKAAGGVAQTIKPVGQTVASAGNVVSAAGNAISGDFDAAGKNLKDALPGSSSTEQKKEEDANTAAAPKKEEAPAATPATQAAPAAQQQQPANNTAAAKPAETNAAQPAAQPAQQKPAGQTPPPATAQQKAPENTSRGGLEGSSAPQKPTEQEIRDQISAPVLQALNGGNNAQQQQQKAEGANSAEYQKELAALKAKYGIK